MDLTDRQKEVLIAVIKEFMGEAEEVGSLALVEKYDLGVSSATIRNEMVKLMGLGLLEKSHQSSGRVPTEQALRLYVSNVLEDKQLSPLVSVEIRQGIYRERFDRNMLIKEILELLSKEADCLAFMILDDEIRYWGVSQLLNNREFKNIERLKTIFSILEDDVFLRNLTSKFSGSGVSLIIGRELGVKDLSEAIIAFIKVPFWDKNEAYVGVIGTKRIDYSLVLPALTEIKKALETSISGWR